ncbi:ABC transporter permease [Pseudodesulfovibrio pelocollis]|uniref:ABC transporter permease n=1 Tax=Pseudodesulfovibrio pelocollis TaxID=3051432 RepID=UPI00255B1D89|nr:FtsX-like permease family protein [Pseudodesulfovibrio sp. SB368]
MNILVIPLRNLRMKWARSLLLLLVFTLGVASIVALNLVSGVVGESLERKLVAYGANILVMPRTEKLTVSYGGFSMGDMLLGASDLDEARTMERIAAIHHGSRVSAIAPKLVSMARVDGTAVGVIGVRWEREMAIKGYWAVDGEFPAREDGVLAGSRAAASLGLVPGDTLSLGSRTAVVTGVLRPTGGDDDSVLFTGMDFAQAAFGRPGRADYVEVAALCAGCPIEEIVDQIAEALPGAEVQALQSVVRQRMYSVDFVQRLILSVSLIILLIACAMVGATMLSSVNERIREIGLLRSLGFSRPGVFAIFCFEAVVLGAAAGCLGYVAGHALSLRVIGALDITEGATLAFSAAGLALTCLLIVAVSVLSAFFPAWKASSVEPSEALISL